MTFFSQQSAYSYQTTSKPYYATTSSLAVSGPTPYWYRPSPSLYVRPGVVYEYQFHGPSPPQPIIQDRYSKVISPFTLSAELAEPIEEVDPVTEAVDSHLLEASAVTIESDDTSTDATVVQVSTDRLFDDEELTHQSTTPAEDVTTPLEQVNELIQVEATTIPDDITTTQQPDTLTTESPVTFERHQSIIPFYLRPSSWRARSFGPDPRYYQPNHYYGPEEARDLPSI